VDQNSVDNPTTRELAVKIADNKDFFERTIFDFEKRMDERFASQVAAISKAEVAVEKRLEGMNEFRSQLDDMIATLVPKVEYDNRHHEIVATTDRLRLDLTTIKEDLIKQLQMTKDDMRQMISDFKEDLQREIHNLEVARDTAVGRRMGIDKSWGIVSIIIGTLIAAAGVFMMWYSANHVPISTIPVK
jgi:hypothetical protein